jgi:hypothetical protein
MLCRVVLAKIDTGNRFADKGAQMTWLQRKRAAETCLSVRWFSRHQQRGAAVTIGIRIVRPEPNSVIVSLNGQLRKLQLQQDIAEVGESSAKLGSSATAISWFFRASSNFFSLAQAKPKFECASAEFGLTLTAR